MTTENKIKWILKQHERVNHFYDEYIPYEFHLRMVVQAAKNHINLIPDMNDGVEFFRDQVILAAWGHDLLEDVHGVSYNDIRNEIGSWAADIIYACTNEKGKNRKERANDKYYEGIRDTSGAVFVKLCDRIANVQYSKLTRSRMFEMYKKEHQNFELMLGRHTNNKDLEPMFSYLSKLFED